MWYNVRKWLQMLRQCCFHGIHKDMNIFVKDTMHSETIHGKQYMQFEIGHVKAISSEKLCFRHSTCKLSGW